MKILVKFLCLLYIQDFQYIQNVTEETRINSTTVTIPNFSEICQDGPVTYSQKNASNVIGRTVPFKSGKYLKKYTSANIIQHVIWSAIFRFFGRFCM